MVGARSLPVSVPRWCLALFVLLLTGPDLAGQAPEAASPDPGTPQSASEPPESFSEQVAESSDSSESGLTFALEGRRLQGMRAQAATLLVQGGQGGGLPMAVFAAPSGAGVPVLIEIEGLGLLDEASGAESPPVRELEIYAYALTATGSVKGYLSQSITFDTARWGEAVFSGGLKLVGHLDVPSGDYSLRVLVFEPDSQRYGLRTLPLVVPAPDDPRPLILGAVAPDPAASWVLVREDTRPPRTPWAGTPLSTGGTPLSTDGVKTSGPTPEDLLRPLLDDQDSALPGAWPVLRAAQERRLDVLAVGLEEPTLELTLRPQPTATDGGEPASTTPVIWDSQSRASLGAGMQRLRGQMVVPEVPTGAYLLEVKAGGAAYTLPVLVLSEATPGDALAWGEVRSLLRSPRERSAGLVGDDLPSRKRPRNKALERAVRQSYRDALAALAEGGGIESTLAFLDEFETSVLAQAPAAGLDALAAGRRDLMRNLADLQPETLVPLLFVQSRLYRHYRDGGRFGLATYARQAAVEIAELYAETVATEGAANLASSALTLLGRDLLEARVWAVGGDILDRALKLDPDNDAALLLLATHQEKMGNYDEAVLTLEQLVAHNPKSAEGRLRLALNLRRARGNGGEALLQNLIAENNPPWTLSVAYSELAERLLSRGRDREASLLLRQALDRLPDEGSLLVQLAFALDRQREFLAARDVAARLADRRSDPGPSPRHRYGVWPDQEMRAIHELLDRGASTRLPLLGQALSQSAEGGVGGSR